MTSTSGRRVARQFSTAMIDQVVLSGANFLVGFILIRFTSDRDYGLYVLVQSGLLLLTTSQNAWVSGPLSVVVPRRSAEQRRDMLGAVKQRQRRMIRMIALPLLIVPILSYALGLLSATLSVVMLAGTLAGWAALRREYLRGVLLIYARPHALLGADCVYAGVMLLGVTLAVLFAKVAVIWATLALVVSAFAGAAVADRSISADPGWGYTDPAPIYREIRHLGVWSVIGAVIYWFFSQSFNYLLASRLDLKAVADVNAARLILMPAIVLTIGLQGILAPTAARWFAEVGLRHTLRRLILITLGVGALDLCYFAAVWIFRDWLIIDLLHKHIRDQDRLLTLWAGVAFVGLLRDVLQCALFALGQVKSMAWQIAISAAVSLLIMWYGLSRWGAAAVLIGQIVGEVINLVGIILIMRKQLQLAPTS